MSELAIAPMDAAAALAIARWRYPPPYDVYNIADSPAEVALFLAGLEHEYYQLRDGAGALVAFCCFGAEARVPGGDYSAPALDVGLGVRPDLTGRGQGRRFLEAALAFGAARSGHATARLTVAAFNTRAIRLYARCGFAEVGRFESAFGGREFVVMTRGLRP